MKSPHHPTVRRYARRGTVVVLAATASMPAVIAVSALVDPIGVVQASAPDGAQLWDSTVVHDIAITADAALLADAIATYVDTGERKQIEASITIDGTTIDQVGMTLGDNGTGFGITAETDPSTVDWVIQLDAFVDGQNYQGVTEFDVTAERR